MTTTIVKWGNSQGIRLPKVLLENINLTENDVVEITTEDNKIIIKKAENKKKPKNIEELFEGYEGNYQPVKINWGKPEGKEIW